MHFKVLIFFLFFSLFTVTSFSQYNIPYDVIGAGGGFSSSQSFQIEGTAGETVTGSSFNSVYSQYSGFWYIYLSDAVSSGEQNPGEAPSVFRLFQNYPNPFNPVTIIKFGVPERSNVVLKIYDILGGEIITVVNQELDKGWYEREFRASGYASGIYIYRMQAGNFVSTRKMVILK